MNSALKLACGLNGNSYKVLELLDGGADVDAVDETHTTALHVAARLGSIDIVKLLIQYDANVDIKNNVGNTPLMLCIRFMTTHPNNRPEPVDYFEVVKKLINANADVNSRNMFGCSPLHEAALSGSRRVAELLVKHGAKVFARDVHNRRPFDMVSVGNSQNPDNQTNIAIYLYDEMERVEQSCRYGDFLPFAMGLHPRLGDISGVRVLSTDTLSKIWHELRLTHNLPIEE
jgi:ankyrin repeat protein